MTLRRLGLGPHGVEAEALMATFAAIRAELQVPGPFPEPVEAEARRAIAALELPVPDATDLPLVTLDPPGSQDLDQALHIERVGSGYRLWYAIADVPAFVAAGSLLDQQAWSRGQTLYLPDGRVPLHPPMLSEDAASLLPDQVRPAYLWQFDLDGHGALSQARVQRSRVRSTARLDYPSMQAALNEGTAPEVIRLLAEVGGLRIALEHERGGASLPIPDQQVRYQDGHYQLEFRPTVPIEEYNAQVSLLTGMAAADLMLAHGIGILRTMPAPDPDAVEELRDHAQALGTWWPSHEQYGDFLRRLDRTDPRHLAVIHRAAGLFRGAGYTPFDGAAPAKTLHAAVAAPYAHVTAPLRRLVDRYGLAVCEALCHGQQVPGWAREALAGLPQAMQASDRLASAVERACTDAVEVAVLADLIGQELPAVVIEQRSNARVLVQISEPAVLATCAGTGTPGHTVTVRVVSADLAERKVQLEVVHR